jgi:hypothetical protein
METVSVATSIIVIIVTQSKDKKLLLSRDIMHEKNTTYELRTKGNIWVFFENKVLICSNKIFLVACKPKTELIVS